MKNKFYLSCILIAVVFFATCVQRSNAQSTCNLSSVLPINTGYNHISSTVIPHNQRDTFWKVTAISAASASYFAAIPSLPYSAYSVIGMYWPTRTSTSEWISFLPNGTYTEIPPHPVDSLWTEYSRDFKICQMDTFLFNLQLTNDNFCKRILVDGIPVPPLFPFSQASSLSTTHHTSWTTIPSFTMALSPGVHRLSFVIHNFPVGYVTDNPVGFSVRGTINSSAGRNTIVNYTSALDCICGCSLTVKALPKDTVICTGDSILLSASGAKNYKWTPNLYLSNSNSATTYFKGAATQKYIVEGSDSFGCKAYDSVLIRVNPLPVINATPKNSELCIGDSVQLNVGGGLTYLWFPDDGVSNSKISNPKLKITETKNKIFVRGYDLNGCSNIDSVGFKLLPSPIVIVSPNDTFGCAGTYIQLTVSGAKNYKWIPNTGIDFENSSTPVLTITSTFNFLVEGTDSNGCKGFDTLRITSFPIPDLKITQEQISDNCFENEFQLNASGANNYTWTPNIYCDNNAIPNPRVKVPHTLVFTVSGSNEFGCIGQDTVTVFHKSSSVVRIPNSFTPNNDGLNDKFKPLVICGFVLSEFSIYNRWGQQVFITSDQNKAWDGYFNKEPSELGVYFYMLKGKDAAGEDVFMKGDVTLIR